MLTLQLQNHLITHENISKYLRYKGCEVLFDASRRCQAESTTQSLLEQVEQSSCHPLLHLLCVCCAGFSPWLSKHTDATAVPQLTSGGRLCTTRTLWMALESCGHQGELGWWQPDFSCKVCLRIAWFLLKPFTVQVISTAIHLSGFWCYCKKICCVVHSTQNLLIQSCQLGRMTPIYTFG